MRLWVDFPFGPDSNFVFDVYYCVFFTHILSSGCRLVAMARFRECCVGPLWNENVSLKMIIKLIPMFRKIWSNLKQHHLMGDPMIPEHGEILLVWRQDPTDHFYVLFWKSSTSTGDFVSALQCGWEAIWRSVAIARNRKADDKRLETEWIWFKYDDMMLQLLISFEIEIECDCLSMQQTV